MKLREGRRQYDTDKATKIAVVYGNGFNAESIGAYYVSNAGKHSGELWRTDGKHLNIFGGDSYYNEEELVEMLHHRMSDYPVIQVEEFESSFSKYTKQYANTPFVLVREKEMVNELMNKYNRNK